MANSLSGSVTSQSSQVVDAGSSTGGGLQFSDLSMTILTKFIQVLEAAIVIIATYFIVRWIRSKFEKMETDHAQQKTAINLLEKICSGFAIVVGVTLALKTVGLDMSILVSVALLGLSYGLKDIIKNYVAGILIFFKAPFKIGDVVKIKNYVGKVDKMDLQSTSIKTFDNRDVTIYNSDVMMQSISNYSRYPMRRLEIDVNLGYGTDIDKATRIFDQILANDPNVLKTPKYSIVFSKFTNNSVVVRLKFWVAYPSNILKIRSQIAWQIQQAFDEETLYMPYQKTVQPTEDFTLTPARKSRVKEFYSRPTFTDIKAPTQNSTITITSVTPLTQDFVDAEEPVVED
ncbi:MAG: mechanosensitive ion channel domain-containing protein [Candidatus Gracilibacteria bacterium]